MARSSDFENFPHLTPEEFSEACHLFDRRYSQATLGRLRRRWQMQVVSAFGMPFGFHGGQTTYVQIIKPLEADLDHAELSLDLTKFSFRDDSASDLGMNDQAMVEAEDSDEVHHRAFASLVSKTDRQKGRNHPQTAHDRHRACRLRDPPPSHISNALSLVHATRPARVRASVRYGHRLPPARAGPVQGRPP